MEQPILQSHTPSGYLEPCQSPLLEKQVFQSQLPQDTWSPVSPHFWRNQSFFSPNSSRIPGALSVPISWRNQSFFSPHTSRIPGALSVLYSDTIVSHTSSAPGFRISTEGNSLLYIGLDTNFTGDTIYSFHLISKVSNNGLQSDRNCKIRFGDNDSFPLNIKKKINLHQISSVNFYIVMCKVLNI